MRQHSLRKRLAYWAVALGVAVPLLYASLRGISWPDVWALISRAAPGLLAASFAVASGCLFLRALRWRVLLSASARVHLTTVFAATAVGYCGNLFLPARAGELVRTLMVSRSTGLSKAFVLTTALCERLSDAMALVLISSFALLELPLKPGWLRNAAGPFVMLALAGIVTIIFLPKLEPMGRRWLPHLPVSERMQSTLLSLTEHVISGLRTFHDLKVLSAFSALTAVIWFGDACTVVLIMRALALPGTLVIAILLTTALALGSALPSTPGYIGVYQFVAVSVLTPFGFTKTDAIGYILVFQALQYVLMLTWAGLGALIWRAKYGGASRTDASGVDERSA